MQSEKVVFLGDSVNSKEPLGIQRYAYEMLRAMDETKLPFECQVLVPEYQEILLEFKNIKVVRYGSHKGFWWRQIDFPKYCKVNNALSVDLTLGLPMSGADIVCFHDCIYESYPNDFVGLKRKLKRKSYLIRARRNIRKSRAIITVSNTSKSELKSIYHIPDDKISVINNAWQHYSAIVSDNQIIEELGIKEREFYFSLGSRLPHKNFEWMIAAARQNPRDTFVVTGSNKIAGTSDNQTPANIIFTGYLSDSQVKALMENCKAYVHPAIVEGFGIPPLEALSCGADIIISKASCLPEIYGKAASYFDPLEYENIDLDKLYEKKSEECKKSVLDKYSWNVSASKMINVIISVMGG